MKDSFEECHMHVLIEVVLFDMERVEACGQTCWDHMTRQILTLASCEPEKILPSCRSFVIMTRHTLN